MSQTLLTPRSISRRCSRAIGLHVVCVLFCPACSTNPVKRALPTTCEFGPVDASYSREPPNSVRRHYGSSQSTSGTLGLKSQRASSTNLWTNCNKEDGCLTTRPNICKAGVRWPTVSINRSKSGLGPYDNRMCRARES